jgi:phage host-nuclease inhibitor protein Gam
MGHKVKNYSANHRDEIARLGKTGKKKTADVAARCSQGMFNPYG